MRFLYGFTISLSAFLLFSVEPMVTRALLPQLGGTSAVWIGALAFFQVVLLLGYGYALLVSPASRKRRALWLLHLGVLLCSGFAVLVFRTATSSLGLDLAPQLRLFLLLGSSIGLPFYTLCTTAPLLQAWYARREQTTVPYRLFGLSNLASLAALLLYPFLLERYLGLPTQLLLWRFGFVLYLGLAAVLTLRMRSAVDDDAPVAAPKLSSLNPRRSTWFWFLLPAIASLQLAAVTEHLTQDVASMPLLWVVPLAAYLLSFVLAFEFPQLYDRNLVLKLLAVLLLALGYFLSQTGFNLPIGINVVSFSAELLLAAWFCHAEVFALRPPEADRSPRFYLALAAGGAAGTLAVAVVSPLLTDSNFDLPFSFALTAVAVLLVLWRQGWVLRLFWGAAAASGVYLLVLLHTAYTHDALLRARNFYGTLRVKESRYPPQAFLSRSLFNGAIEHGMEWFSTEFHDAPLTYYEPDSGVGLVLDHCCGGRPRHIGVIGLGAGTLAAYGRPGDRLRFYEINPLVTGVAQHLFTFTRDTRAQVAVVPGDARLTLASEAPQGFDVLVVDAFSGDSIPVHLLTREALTLYRRQLAPGGMIVFHISNQFLDLAPVIARLAASTQADSNGPLIAREVDSGPAHDRGESLASWVVLSPDRALFADPAFAHARPLPLQENVRLWTDAYSSLLPILRWTGRH